MWKYELQVWFNWISYLCEIDPQSLTRPDHRHGFPAVTYLTTTFRRNPHGRRINRILLLLLHFSTNRNLETPNFCSSSLDLIFFFFFLLFSSIRRIFSSFSREKALPGKCRTAIQFLFINRLSRTSTRSKISSTPAFKPAPQLFFQLVPLVLPGLPFLFPPPPFYNPISPHFPPNRVFRSRLLSSLLPRPCLSPVMGGLICRRLVSDHRPTLSPNRYGIRSRGICPGSSAIWSLWYFPTLSVRTLERLWGIGICGGLSFSLCSSVLLFPGLHRSRRLAL